MQVGKMAETGMLATGAVWRGLAFVAMAIAA